MTDTVVADDDNTTLAVILDVSVQETTLDASGQVIPGDITAASTTPDAEVPAASACLQYSS